MGLGQDEFPVKLTPEQIKTMVYEIQKHTEQLQDVLIPKTVIKDDKKASAVDDDFKKPQTEVFNDTYLVWEPETQG